MASVSWIRYRDKEILFTDYKGCKNEQEMIDLLREAQRQVIAHKGPYLQLTDITGCSAGPKYMSEAKKVAQESPKTAIRRAIVGIDSQARRILLHAYNLMLGIHGIRPFSTLEEAQEWLTS